MMAKWQVGGIYNIDTPEKETIDTPGGVEYDSVSFHHYNQKSTWFKIYQFLFQFNIFRPQLIRGNWNHKKWNCR
jgi:hypothetical protein